MFTYEKLHTSFEKGLRNGNWRKLSRLEKALYMASLWCSRVRGAIINGELVKKLSVLVEKLKETSGAKIFRRGYEKAGELLNKCESIFAGAPSLREWLKDPDYVFWLGANEFKVKNQSLSEKRVFMQMKEGIYLSRSNKNIGGEK